MAGQAFELGLFVQSGDPTTTNEVAATVFLLGQLGRVFSINNQTLFNVGVTPRVYCFVQRSATDAATLTLPGSQAFWKSYDNAVVTATDTDSYDAVGVNHIAGCFPGIALTAGNYGFIQVGGQGPCNGTGSGTAASTAGLPILGKASGGTQPFQIAADYNAAGTSVQVVGKTLTAANAGGIGAGVNEALWFPTRVGW
jgi:hypothetical protein